MAEQDRPELFDVHGRGRGERGEQIAVAPIDHLRRPGGPGPARGVDFRGAQRVEGLDHPAVTVPAHEHDRVAQPTKPLDRLGRQRAGHDVTSDDDPIDALVLDSSEHRLQRRKIAVDVIERCDSHRRRGQATSRRRSSCAASAANAVSKATSTATA